MTAISRAIPAGFTTTNASFRAWGSAISTLLDDAGLAKTADTGQINWTSVSRPTAANTIAGYEIRVHDSTLGDTYVRLDYTTGNNASGANALIKMTVGTGSDGAGTITGVMFTGMASVMEGSGSTTAARSDTTSFTSYAMVDDGMFAMSLCPAKVSLVYCDLLVFARTAGADGAYNGNGFITLNQYSNATGLLAARYWSYELGAGRDPDTAFPSPGLLGYPYYGTAPSMEADSAAAFHVIEHFTPTLNYHRGIVVLNAADVALGGTITATVLGASRTYLSLGSTYKGLDGDLMGGSSARAALGLIWS